MPKSIFSIQQEQLQEVLRQVRVDAGLTQSDLAKRLGQPQSFVSKYESGERLLDLVELRRICKAVGISLVDLVRKWESSVE
ncbi:MAG: helix-turn-helix transcriptional regulator [Deltaproteobacteria bacterium]|nr:helix-turn-helix transcriptional regulator [Deltaproteobacteria bacterium]MCZ6625172.1 helix-turn-helix transcriptional regulator [Deltaproteobacteria bacterium]